MMTEFIVIAILLLLSGFFSSSEMAFVVSNKIKIELRARKKMLTARYAQYFNDNPRIFFSTILIANNIVNIAFASLCAVILAEQFQYNEWTILIISTIVLLLVGELIPKYFAREIPDAFVLTTAIPIRIVSIILYPLVKVTSSISNILTRSAGINEERIAQLFEKEDVHSLIYESSAAGKIDENESDIIKKVLDLSEQNVYESMTPRTAVVGIELKQSIKEVINTFIHSGYSKLPVYDETIDNIKGFVHAYDMFNNPNELNDVVREIAFVPETKKGLDTLNEFLDRGASIAVVVDEFGGTAGIVTVEDLLEEMLGEIRDEFDVEENICKLLEDGTFIISGRVEIDIINEEYELNIPNGDYATIGGYITSKIGHIPEAGKIFTLDQFEIRILRSDKKKVELIKLYPKEE
ncbi:MAG: hemolysin family protein [Bacteroidetes bacterium]|nr:hemolysin family protein [Bacteroidota bacterium]